MSQFGVIDINWITANINRVQPCLAHGLTIFNITEAMERSCYGRRIHVHNIAHNKAAHSRRRATKERSLHADHARPANGR